RREAGSDSRSLVVLGMHRSGTSVLISCLGRAGVHLGAVLDQPHPLHGRGVHEPAALVLMHDDLLAHHGGSWHNPPAVGEWPPLHRAVRDLFIESRHGRPLWGFKDPRLLLCLEGWRQALPNLEPVGVFRHPAAVARSLLERDGMGLDKGVALWSHYNQRLLELHQQQPFPLIEFEADANRVRQSLALLLQQLELPGAFSQQGVDDALNVFEPQWRRHSDARLALAAPVLGLYEELRQRALSPT
ncbi:MAG: sulfotransferase family protein, partial [Cyanobium sp. 49614_E6]|nr:sulfotransferase family protein [Cyanobium sp. 49614_E6]